MATSRRKTADERAAARKRKSKERAERRKSRATAAAGKRKQKQKKSRRGAEPAERSHGESSESPDAAGESVALPAQSGRPGGLTVAVLVLIAVIFALALFVAALVTKAG